MVVGLDEMRPLVRVPLQLLTVSGIGLTHPYAIISVLGMLKYSIQWRPSTWGMGHFVLAIAEAVFDISPPFFFC